MSRYSDFSVDLLRVGSTSKLAAGDPAGASASVNGNANSSSLVYAYLAPTALTANTEGVFTSAVPNLTVGDVIVYAPQASAPAPAAAVRAFCATAGTLSVGFLSGATPTPATGMYRFLVMKAN